MRQLSQRSRWFHAAMGGAMVSSLLLVCSASRHDSTVGLLLGFLSLLLIGRAWILFHRMISIGDRFLQPLLDAIPAHVYIKDVDSRMLFVNRHFELVFKTTKEKTIGRLVTEIFPEEAARVFVKNDRKVVETKTLVVARETAQDALGRERIYHSEKFPLLDRRGEVYAVCGISTDITERVHAESLIEQQRGMLVHSSKMSSLGEMASGIAHEINNPLAIIYGKAHLLRLMAEQGSLEPGAVEQLTGQIEKTAMRISKIVRSLRSFARDAEADPLERVPLKQIVEETLELCQERFLSRKVSLKVDQIPENLDVLCRSVAISQVLLNLLNNAFDAVDSGQNASPWISLTAQEDQDQVVISVGDNGPGIPESIKDRILEPFFTTKEVGKGTGLGLSVANAILSQHQGKLWIDSCGGPTCFKFSLPKGSRREILAQ